MRDMSRRERRGQEGRDARKKRHKVVNSHSLRKEHFSIFGAFAC
jgi:hypothetical protein